MRKLAVSHTNVNDTSVGNSLKKTNNPTGNSIDNTTSHTTSNTSGDVAKQIQEEEVVNLDTSLNISIHSGSGKPNARRLKSPVAAVAAVAPTIPVTSLVETEKVRMSTKEKEKGERFNHNAVYNSKGSNHWNNYGMNKPSLATTTTTTATSGNTGSDSRNDRNIMSHNDIMRKKNPNYSSNSSDSNSNSNSNSSNSKAMGIRNKQGKVIAAPKSMRERQLLLSQKKLLKKFGAYV